MRTGLPRLASGAGGTGVALGSLLALRSSRPRWSLGPGRSFGTPLDGDLGHEALGPGVDDPGDAGDLADAGVNLRRGRRSGGHPSYRYQRRRQRTQ
ncbi:hypothetical protein AB0D67_30700 [Streptosporangium sp. NPDC048047]|uniref:hypothetical protein n=1 Tax=Streptosporangium sp. NPDC048047 TaxID=3155748 RepID=UPI00342C9128